MPSVVHRLAAAALLALSSSAVGQDPAPLLSRHPYLQLATQKSIVVVWRTSRATEPVVRFGKSIAKLDRVVPGSAIVRRAAADIETEADTPRLHSAPDGTWQYEARLDGLEPDTVYRYAVHDGASLLAGGDDRHRFRTLPTAGSDRPLRFWVVGDSGTGGPAQRRVLGGAARYVFEKSLELDAFLHVGDMAYTRGRDAEFQRGFFDVYRPLLQAVVCWPAMGNHEGMTSSGATGIGPYYDAYVLPTRAEAGGVPSGTEAFYSFDFGKVHFVVLDSFDLDRGPAGAMARWLEADLAQTRAEWLVAYWHHPPYSMGTHDSDRERELREMRTHVMPILESAGVDLVLTGHSHIYERSMLIDGAYATPTVVEGVVLDDGNGDPSGHGAYRKSAGLTPHQGDVNVVAGHGGAGLGRRGTMPIMRSILLEHGSFLFEIEKDTLTGTMIGVSGEARDRFRIVKRGAVEPRVVEHPWQPLGPRFTPEYRAFADRLDVTITARPDAPDAVVHYTVDGSEPTLDSPIAEGPIRLDATTTLRAFSVWRDGLRMSPESSSFFERMPAGTLIRRIWESGGDVEENAATGLLYRDSTDLEMSTDRTIVQIVALRFEELALSPRRKIARAWIQFGAAGKSVGDADLEIRAELSPAAAAIGPAARDVSRRELTKAVVSWKPAPWLEPGARGPDQRTPDLGPLLEEIVALEGWREGGSVVFVITGKGRRNAKSFESGRPAAPTLYVELAR